MKRKTQRNKAWLLRLAQAVARDMKPRVAGTPIRIRVPSAATGTNTDGWAAVIGNLGSNRPRLEIWLDRFSGHNERKLSFCFRSENRRQIVNITNRVASQLVPIRTVGEDDYEDENKLVLIAPLRKREFKRPILEKYPNGRTFFGVYDMTHDGSERIPRSFLNEASAFFESVARTLPYSKPEEDIQEVYPQAENRKLVESHLRRERSRLLAVSRKCIDNHTCQVCRLRFEDVYGELGIDFAEVHHIVPLARLRGIVKTRIEDLLTVCANCHRMLHRMDGKPDDIAKLRAIVRKHRRRSN